MTRKSRMTFLIISCGVRLLGIVLILSPGKAANGKHSFSYEPIDLNSCHQLVNGTHERYRTFECEIPSRKWCLFDLKPPQCLSLWCHRLASAFNQSPNWVTLCSNRFYRFRLSQFDISTTTGKGLNASPVRNIHVKYYKNESGCRDTHTVIVKFAIKTSGYRCQSKYNQAEVKSGNDCDGKEDDYDLIKEIINAIDTLDVQKSDSLQDAVNVFEIKIKEYANRTSFPGASLNRTMEQKMKEVFKATVPFEEFAIWFGRYHLTHKGASIIHLTNKNVDLQVRKRFYKNESDFHLEEPQGQNYIRFPSGDFHNGSVLLGVVYKDLIDLFLNNKNEAINKSSKSLNTAIMSATINPPTAVALQENVTLMFSNVKQDATRNRECVFWNFSENSPVGWSGQGCHVKWMNDSKTVCSCNHLTHFAVLMQFDTTSADSAGHKNNRITEADEKILEILTYVFLTLSLIGMTLTIICYVFLTDVKAPLSQIRISLVASLGAGQIMFLSGIGATKNKQACVTVAALVQYFLMAAFCWMLVEGIYLYLFVVKVYNVSNQIKICHGASWGLPAVIVVLSLSIAAGMDGIESFVSEKYCWMSSSNGLIWIFVSFVIAIELVNILILVRVIKEMTAMEQTKDNHVEQIRLGIRACVVLIPLLGVTWLFGVLSSTHKAFAYIFTIFNSTQGFLIFLLHCVRNSEIRERFRRKFRLIFPAASDGSSAVKRNSKVNDSNAIISLRKIDIMPKSTESLVAISS